MQVDVYINVTSEVTKTTEITPLPNRYRMKRASYNYKDFIPSTRVEVNTIKAYSSKKPLTSLKTFGVERRQ